MFSSISLFRFAGVAFREWGLMVLGSASGLWDGGVGLRALRLQAKGVSREAFFGLQLSIRECIPYQDKQAGLQLQKDRKSLGSLQPTYLALLMAPKRWFR